MKTVATQESPAGPRHSFDFQTVTYPASVLGCLLPPHVALGKKQEEITVIGQKKEQGIMTKAVFSLKLALRGSKPPIWRRLLVADTKTLADLHETIQGAMGWERCHAHAFEIGGKQYGDPEFLEDISDETETTLETVYKSGVTSFKYTYDFGDHWEHTITIEKTQAAIEGQVYPICIAGKRNCPPEDCGGIWGYEELLQILANPASPGRKKRLEWLGGNFDPENFSVEATNERLAAYTLCEEI